MSLFFDLLSAINNPNQQANVSQLTSVMSSVQALTNNHNIPSSQLENVMSVAGNLIRPVMQQQQGAIGEGRLQNLLGQAANAGANGTILQSLISPQIMQQMGDTIAQRTGVSSSIIQSAMPSIISTVMGLLNMGAAKSSAWGGANPLLTTFLDQDRDGDTDLGDVMKFAKRFLNPAATA